MSVLCPVLRPILRPVLRGWDDICDWYPVVVTPPVGTVPCGALQANGASAWPATFDITLGTGVGTVTLTFQAYTAPDKFIVVYDGDEVINTGYRGTSSQAALNARLAYNGAPPEPIAGPGAGTATFVKTTPNPATARVYVWGPGAPGTTIWNFTLGCPDGIIPP